MRSSGYTTLVTWRTRRSSTSRGRSWVAEGPATGVGACSSQRGERTYSAICARRATTLGGQRWHRSTVADSARTRDTECRRRRQRIVLINGIDVLRGTPRQPAAIQLPLTHIRGGARGRWGARARAEVYAPRRRSSSRRAHTTVDRSGYSHRRDGCARPDNTHRFRAQRATCSRRVRSAGRLGGRNDRRRRSPTWLTKR